jgi:hypothetical protein
MDDNRSRSLTDVEQALVGTYQARHRRWSSPFILNPDGTFLGGGESPNGTWEFDGKLLTVRWFHWPLKQLIPLGHNRFDGDFTLISCVRASPSGTSAVNMPSPPFVFEINQPYVPFLHQRDARPRNVLLVSFFMSNIPPEALTMQRKIFNLFDLPLRQVLFLKTHPEAIDKILKNVTGYDYLIALDLDAVPLTNCCVPKLLFNVDYYGGVVGIAQQANHLHRNHPYAGPACFAISMDVYSKLGSPSFNNTARSDVGEELTWRSHEAGIPVCLLWPTHVEEPKWRLGNDKEFGLGTTYENEVYHAFETRFSSQRFITRCKSILQNAKRN